MRYIWDSFDDYFGPSAFAPVRWFARLFRPYLQWCDLKSNKSVTHFLANSTEVQNRIKRIYGRDSEVIHPPVDLDKFKIKTGSGEYFLIISALVPYKKIDLAVKVCNKNHWPLVIAGKGSEEKKLRAIAGPTVKFDGWVSDEKLSAYYDKAKALIFPGKEDFGIVPVESMASGCPVIAFGEGGVLDSVEDGKTGVFFFEQTEQALEDAIRKFETMTFDPNELRQRAARFSKERFLFKTQIYFRRLYGIPTIPENNKF